MSELPQQVDCIVIGTGLTNSIIAAACSRIGKSVLHSDSRNYYGHDWASFTFSQLVDWLRIHDPQNKSLAEIPQELFDKSRQFCIDLCPKLLFSNGKMVELLINSNVSRYHEFSNKIRVLTIGDEGQIQTLPYKRNDVFTSSLLSNLVDKRRLTKFIEICLTVDEHDVSKISPDLVPYLDKPIKEFLESRQLKDTMSKLIINSVAMVEPHESTRLACKNIKKFMLATERYGKSPFFFPFYGSGEFPQSFCRLSAVFGATYCLNKKINNVIINDTSNAPSKFTIEFDENQYKVDCSKLILNTHDAMRLKFVPDNTEVYISRAIVISKFSVHPHEDDSFCVSFLRIPTGSSSNTQTVFFVEVNSFVAVTPADYFISYFWTLSKSKGEDVLQQVVKNCYGNNHDKLIWSCFYKQKSGMSQISGVQDLFITTLPDDDIDYDKIVDEAERIFKTIYPADEFLPRAPDPEEIL